VKKSADWECVLAECFVSIIFLPGVVRASGAEDLGRYPGYPGSGPEPLRR
jgi:hypothetical protein